MNVETQRIAPAPIRKSLRVKASPDKAFEVFTASMGQWWLKSHSLLQSPQRDVVVEPLAGGRWFEVGEDGSECPWGHVLIWAPPERLVLAWQLNADWTYDPTFHTTVEVRFKPDGDHTLVEFEHRDLERFGARADELRGGYESGMDGGWTALLDHYRQQFEEAA